MPYSYHTWLHGYTWLHALQLYHYVHPDLISLIDELNFTTRLEYIFLVHLLLIVCYQTN